MKAAVSAASMWVGTLTTVSGVVSGSASWTCCCAGPRRVGPGILFGKPQRDRIDVGPDRRGRNAVEDEADRQGTVTDPDVRNPRDGRFPKRDVEQQRRALIEAVRGKDAVVGHQVNSRTAAQIRREPSRQGKSRGGGGLPVQPHHPARSLLVQVPAEATEDRAHGVGALLFGHGPGDTPTRHHEALDRQPGKHVHQTLAPVGRQSDVHLVGPGERSSNGLVESHSKQATGTGRDQLGLGERDDAAGLSQALRRDSDLPAGDGRLVFQVMASMLAVNGSPTPILLHRCEDRGNRPMSWPRALASTSLRSTPRRCARSSNVVRAVSRVGRLSA